MLNYVEESERDAWLWLLSIPGIYRNQFSSMLKYFGSPLEIYRSPGSEWNMFRRAGLKWVDAVLEAREKTTPEELKRQMEQSRIRLVLPSDEAYPARLREIADPPYGLFASGEMPENNVLTAAVVGARACSAYGRKMAADIGAALAERGIQVISGMALGIDGAAQQAALEKQGYVLAVLGSGADVCYPREHIELYRQLREQGGVLSEFPCGAKPLPAHFPMRNRIISGISDAVIVVEAREKSGSLITADQALDQGRDVYAVPGRSIDALSMGSNTLIAGGAGIVLNVEDLCRQVLENGDRQGRKCRQKNCHMTGPDEKIRKNKRDKENIVNKRVLAPDEERVYSFFDLSPVGTEELADAAGITTAKLRCICTRLELQGLIVRIGPDQYRRI